MKLREYKVVDAIFEVTRRYANNLKSNSSKGTNIKLHTSRFGWITAADIRNCQSFHLAV